MSFVYNDGVKFVSKFFAALLVSCLSFLTLSVTNAAARVISVEKGVATIAKGEIVNDDLFIGAQTVEIFGTVNGDVYAGAETIRINGIINGSLHAGGGIVYLSGRVSQNAYVGAANVIVSNAVIGDSLLIGAGNASVDADSSIGGSILAGTGSITINSPVKRNILLGAGNADINSAVGGEVRVGAGNISIGPNAKIAKDLNYALGDGATEINISDSATVGGTINKTENKFAGKKDVELAKNSLPKAFAAIGMVFNIISWAGTLIIGFLCLKLFNKTFSDSANRVTKSFFSSLGVGFLICVAALPAFLILALTGVGLPLAGLAVLVLLINIYLAKIVVGLAVGLFLADKFGWKKTSIYAVFALGLTLIYLLKMIPFLGFVISLAVLWTGLGALALHYKSGLKN